MDVKKFFTFSLHLRKKSSFITSTLVSLFFSERSKSPYYVWEKKSKKILGTYATSTLHLRHQIRTPKVHKRMEDTVMLDFRLHIQKAVG